MKQHWSDELVAMDACTDAVEWAKKQPSASKAWKSCKQGDWMAWLLARRLTGIVKGSAEHIRLVRLSCALVRPTLKYVTKGEDRPRLAIEAAEAWCDNPTPAAASAARAAARAARAAASAAWAAARAAGAANSAADSAAWAAWAAASAAQAKIIRRFYPKAPTLAGAVRDRQ